MASGSCVSEVGHPTSGEVPKATVILIAGGAWLSGSYYPTLPQVQRMARVFREAGYLTLAVEHTSARVDQRSRLGPDAYRDVVEWYDLVRFLATSYWGPDHPVCVAGASSSGHLALMLAATRAPDCVIAEGAPTNLRDLEEVTRPTAVTAFGAAGLSAWSPSKYGGSRFQMPVLLGHLPDDKLVPIRQMDAFAATRPSVAKMRLATTGAPGATTTVPECVDSSLYLERSFAHLCIGGQQGVTADSLAGWRQREVATVETATGP